MPHIRIRAMTDSDVKQMSQVLPKELSQLMNAPEDSFTIEKIHSTFYFNGAAVPEGQGDPMVEVHWFDRGSEMKAKVANSLTQVVRKYSKSEYIAVVFFDLPKINYFENGQHF